ncbi:SyrP protein [Parasphingopyxis algicola]|uniref:TauD/TfdA family dioxygenase n=1 Tax=Parasphingopyxis algicola TaxID=2026624 RepID=UPI00159F9CE2|nr:TauD/TfdA family dioxygenase [Parasphingopyxis algicola]QLC25359.1 SyrP protein [Parasphingopyxis algicola]
MPSVDIAGQQHWHDRAFPEIHAQSGGDALPELLHSERTAIDASLAGTGAILFRGFGIATAEQFDAAVEAYGAPNFAYDYSLSNAVRINLTPRVFTANEAPPDTSIYLHHEMAQTPLYPSKLFFFCETVAESGGATPICRSDILLERLTAEKPELVDAFAAKGVRYRNVMPDENDASSGQGRSWRATLGVESRNAAEARLRALDYDWEWLDGGALRAITPVLSAVRTLPDGRAVFFNQLIAAYRGWADSRNDPKRTITFGDGSAIDPGDMALAIAIADELTFDIPWQDGDVALIDNFLVMHGRRPFTGKRRVLASLIA